MVLFKRLAIGTGGAEPRKSRRKGAGLPKWLFEALPALESVSRDSDYLDCLNLFRVFAEKADKV
jgi:hypothetical protein